MAENLGDNVPLGFAKVVMLPNTINLRFEGRRAGGFHPGQKITKLPVAIGRFARRGVCERATSRLFASCVELSLHLLAARIFGGRGFHSWIVIGAPKQPCQPTLSLSTTRLAASAKGQPRRKDSP